MNASQKIYIHTTYVASFVFVYFLAFATATHAAPLEYIPLVGLPGLQEAGGKTTIPQYINAVYLLTISLGALFGVIKIAFAGVKYSLSDVVTDKSSAKHDIYGVLLGLAILLIPAIVLNTIYPNLTNLDVLRAVKPVDTTLKATSVTPGTSSVNQMRNFKPQCDADKGTVKVLYDGSLCCESASNTCDAQRVADTAYKSDADIKATLPADSQYMGTVGSAALSALNSTCIEWAKNKYKGADGNPEPGVIGSVRTFKQQAPGGNGFIDVYACVKR